MTETLILYVTRGMTLLFRHCLICSVSFDTFLSQDMFQKATTKCIPPNTFTLVDGELGCRFLTEPVTFLTAMSDGSKDEHFLSNVRKIVSRQASNYTFWHVIQNDVVVLI